MNRLIEKYKDFPFGGEFPNIYMILLYESGGDFTTYSRLLGYTSTDEFVKDYEEFIFVYKHEI